MANSTSSALTEIITDAIQGKKASKWLIQLLIFLGIAIIIDQVFEDMGFPISSITSIILLSILFLVWFSLSVHYRKWLENLINDAISKNLEYNDLGELMSTIEGVLGNFKSIMDDIYDLNRNIARLILLGISNVLFIVFTFLLIDAFFEKALGNDAFIAVGYLGGFLLIGVGLIFYIYFEIKPIQSEDSERRQDDIFSIFVKKFTYDNIIVKKGKGIMTIASLMSLFFLIPQINIPRQSSWLGMYLCTPQLSDYIKDLTKEETKNKVFQSVNMEDFFTCNKISGLEDLVNLQNLLPLEIFSKFRGNVGKDHPAVMRGLTIQLLNQRRKTCLSINVIPWKGFVIRKKLNINYEKQEDKRYVIEESVEDRRIFSIYLMGESDSVESYKFQFALRAPQATAENCFIEK
jgi:hypothetical protein